MKIAWSGGELGRKSDRGLEADCGGRKGAMRARMIGRDWKDCREGWCRGGKKKKIKDLVLLSTVRR